MIKLKIKYFLLAEDNPISGVGSVTKKIISQVSELIRLGLNVELVLLYFGDIQYGSYDFLTTHKLTPVSKRNVIGRIKRTGNINKIFYNTINELGPHDFLYYRYTSALPFYYPINYLKKFRNCRVVTEHQAIEINEHKINHAYLGYLCELFFGGFFKKQSDAIVGVTEEITRYEIKCSRDLNKPQITIGNGFTIKSVPLKQGPSYASLELHLLCVAKYSRWHGIDRLLKGIAGYSGTKKIILHIVGDGSELPYLKQLIYELNIQDHIIFHGFQSGENLDALFNQCHIAIGSLGIHRIGLKDASILKAREYCARGIPYIIAYNDPDFPNDFPYIFKFPADESPIDIEQVIRFASHVCQDNDCPKKMRQYAIENLDWSIKMKKLKDFFEDISKENNH